MSEIRIWLALSYAEAFRTGGWAFVRHDGAAVAGRAGGDRRITSGRLALAALLAALKDTTGGATVITSDAAVGAVPALLAATGEDAPTEDLDLWAQLATAYKARQIRILRQPPAAGSPLAFAAAWAEQGRERAKGGAFVFAIPKPNLAKAGV